MAKLMEVEAHKPKAQPKTLSHLEIHPVLGGGHMVKHVYQGYQHDPKEIKFNEEGIAKGGEHIQAHLDKHAGLPPMHEEDGEPTNPTMAEEETA